MNIVMFVKYPNKHQESVPQWKTLLSYLPQDKWFSTRRHFNTNFHSQSLNGDMEQSLKKFLIITVEVEVQLEACRDQRLPRNLAVL